MNLPVVVDFDGGGETTMTIQVPAAPTNSVGVTAPPRPHARTGNPGTTADNMDIVEVWGRDSFPASDPPANW